MDVQPRSGCSRSVKSRYGHTGIQVQVWTYSPAVVTTPNQLRSCATCRSVRSRTCVRACVCVSARVRACVRARVRACVRARVRACVRACVRVCVCVCARARARSRDYSHRRLKTIEALNTVGT